MSVLLKPLINLRRPILFACIASVGLFAGCNDGRPKRVKVSGRVEIDGRALEYGSVKILPIGHRPAVGRIDEDGRFSLTTYEIDDGVVMGSHTAIVDASEFVDPRKTRWHAPPRYAKPSESGLTVEITGPTDGLLISLTDSGEKPFEPFVQQH